jgi:hypothetical protein
MLQSLAPQQFGQLAGGLPLGTQPGAAQGRPAGI